MRIKLFFTCLVSALLLTAAWPPWGLAPLLFVAFVPLLLVQQAVNVDNRLRARHLFVYAFFTFLVWNTLTTWWIYYASLTGVILAELVNTTVMALVFLLFHKVKRGLPERLGNFALIPIWIAFELLHLDWDLSWPWLTLGNGFADYYHWIQWYEYTGVFGGSFWILLVNVLLFELWIHRNTLLRPLRKKIIHGVAVVLLVLVPILLSYVVLPNPPSSAASGINVVVVQPNVDPYQKFSGNVQEDLDAMLLLAASKADSTTDYIVFPETAIAEILWENDIANTWSINRIQKFQQAFPRAAIVIGASTAHYYASGEAHPITARKFKQSDDWYENYNTALQLDATRKLQQYHKSKLVPGVERMPFPAVFGLLDEFAVDLGGTSGTLGLQAERAVFRSTSGNIAPVICYESIYGNYVADYIRNGAEYIFILTNDGWWHNTPGHKQHLRYARLRAIETRKAIARSANTGISCFINVRGDIEQAQPYWTAAAIQQRIVSQPGQTFYVRHGDYLAWGMSVLCLIGIVWSLVRWWMRRKRRRAGVEQRA